MIEQFSKRPTLSSPSTMGLLAMNFYGRYSTDACCPSTASKVWYRKSPTAQEAYTQGGISVSIPGLYHSIVRKFMTTKLKPERVIWYV